MHTIPRLIAFFVIEPNHAISVNTVIESRDAIFDETRFTSRPRPREINQETIDPTSEPMEIEEEEATVLGPRITRSMALANALKEISSDTAHQGQAPTSSNPGA